MYIETGGRYFDTAYSYLGGKSEEAIGKCLSSRHPRESYMLATKLAGYDVKSYEDCWRQFETQRTRCGVEYFDVYMLHWLNKKNYDLAEKYNEFAFLQELKSKGLIISIFSNLPTKASGINKLAILLYLPQG